MHTALAIFAKTIGLSPVKTRLAASLGQDKAEAFYELSVAATQETIATLAATNNITPYWALGEQEAIHLPQWQTFTPLWTGPGNLGQRLNCIYSQLKQRHDAVILIGTDSPHLTQDYFLQALATLAKHPESCVVGPAIDGGFCLFAGQTALNSRVWIEVTYSQTDTLLQLKKQLQKNAIPVMEITPQRDVDTLEDLQQVKHDLTHQLHRLPKQQDLLNWLNRHLV